MLKGKILLVVLAIMLVATVANAAIFKYPVGSEDVGIVVAADGEEADGTLDATGVYSADRAIGIVIQNDGTDAMVANSGIFDLATASFTAGDILGYTDAGVLEAITAGSGRPVAGVALSETRIMITIENDEAEWTSYDFAAVTDTEAGFLGIAGESPNDVQEALDLIDGYLRELSATLFEYSSTTTAADIGVSDDVSLVSVTPTIPSGVDSLAIGDELYLTFEGEFSDEASVNGAVITLTFNDGTDDVGEAREIYLLNRDFYQKQVVHMESFITAGTASDTYSVVADGDDTYDGGRFISGSISLERF